MIKINGAHNEVGEYMKRRIYIIISILLVSGIIFGGAYIFALYQKEIDTAYNSAVTMIQNGAYEDALSELEKANPKKINRDNFWKDVKYDYIKKAYKDTLPLYAYALAQIEYNDKKRMSTVDEYLSLISKSYSGELSEEIKTFKENFKSEYDVFLAEEARKAEQKRKEDLKKRVPYVGMSESDIANTSLGAPSSNVRHNYEMVGGKSYQANLYDYKSGSKTIFTARCVQGKVTEVWDKRNEAKNTTTHSSSISTSRKKKTYNDDKYDVKDYYDAEDFYDDHYDDFYDYEEAEDYYNEHGDW